jgi:glycerophosphoryl diester phosphodiesterase
MMRLLVRSLADFRTSFKKLLLFEYMFMLLSSFVVIPVITYVFNRILTVLGSGSLLNGDVYRIGLAYEGVLGLVIIGLLASFTLFIELCVLVVMVQQHYFSKQVLISDSLLAALRRTPRLLGFGILQLLFFLLVLIPFIDSPLSESFYALFNFPILINSRVVESSVIMTVVYAFLLLILLYLLLRWVFVLHYIMLEGKSIAEAVRSSMALTRGWSQLKLFLILFLLNALVLSAGFFVLSSLSHLPAWLNINVLKLFSAHYSLTLSSILNYMFALLLLPVNLIFLTRLYFYFRAGQGIRPRDTLELRRSRLGGLERKLTLYFGRRKTTRTLYISITAIYVGLMIFVGFRANENLLYAQWTVLISAHRGDVELAPENSIPAIRSAIDKGVQSVELDVQLTRDGVAVLHHDYTLQRMAGVQLRVNELTYDELSRLMIGEDGNLEPIHIPTLSEALSEAQGKTKLLLDLKPYGPGTELVQKVVGTIQQFGMEREVYIQSFDSESLRLIRELAPDIKIGQILYFALGDLSALDVDFYTIEQVMLTEQLVKRAHSSGREVWVWTVNSSRNMKEVLKFRIDGMITDYPLRAQSMVELNL